MNERIKSLLAKAHLDVMEDLGDIDSNHVAEKFAELIVKECVAICQDVDGEDNIDARSGRQDCAVEIVEHFGVEE